MRKEDDLIDKNKFPIATANTATMIKDGVQAFRAEDGRLVVTREWLANNTHLLGGKI